jgi:hypothetical protein
MTQDEIMKMAREAGLHIATDVNWMPIIGLEYAERFAALVASAERERVQKVYEDAAKDSVKAAIKQEREACAKVCDEFLPLGNKCAYAIRARSKE